MIGTHEEYSATLAANARFEEALAHVDEHAEGRHPLLQQAMKDAIEGELESLRAQVAQYKDKSRTVVGG